MKFALAALIGAASAAEMTDECTCIGVANVVADSDASCDAAADGTVDYTADGTGQFGTFLQDTACNYYDSDAGALGTGTDYGATYGDSCANWDSTMAWCDASDASYVDEDWCDVGYAWCYVDATTCTTDLGGEATEYFADTDYSGAVWYDCTTGSGSFMGSVGVGMTLFLLLIFPIGVPVLLVKAMKFEMGPGWFDGATGNEL